MRLASALVLLLVFGLCTTVVLADPGAPMDEKEWHYDLSGARSTYPELEPNDTCPGQRVECGDVVDPARIDRAGDNDWYQVNIPTVPTQITIGTDASPVCDPDAGDTYIYLMAPDCTTQLRTDDDSGPGLYSLISNYNITTPGVYNIRVRHYSSTSTGCYKLFVTCQAPQPPPPNDTCDGAIAMQRCASGTFTGDLTTANNNYDPGIPGPSCTGFAAAGKDVAYVVNLVAGDVLHLVYTTPSHDGSLYVITDCALPSQTCVVGEDDPEPETITWTATATGTYYIIADAYGTGTGSTFTLDWSVTCPPPTGACCFADGTCRVLSEADCGAQGGTWLGPTVGCDPNPCPQPTGACCLTDPGTRSIHCVVVTRADCEANGGIYMGDGVPCDPDPCPQPEGACCHPDGTCTITTQANCPDQWLGEGTSCEPNPCLQPMGACCYPDGTCRITTQAECTGYWLGMGTVCDPNPCQQPVGACCYPDGTCLVTTEQDCTGQWLGMGTVCDPNPCPQPAGACCFVTGECQVLTRAECADQQGTYQGDGTLCDPNPCPPPVPTKSTSWGQIKHLYR